MLRSDEMLMPFQGTALGTPEYQIFHQDAHWYARAAVVTMRAVRKRTATAKTRLYKHAVHIGIDQVARCRHL